MNLFKLIHYTGIAAMVMLLLTATAGANHWSVHEMFAGITVTLALTHAGLALYKHYKTRPKTSVPPPQR